MLYNKKPSFEKPIKTKHYWFFVTFQNSWRQNLKEQVLKASDLTRIKDINIRLFFILHIDSLFNPTPGIGHRSSTPNFFSFSLIISNCPSFFFNFFQLLWENWPHKNLEFFSIEKRKRRALRIHKFDLKPCTYIYIYIPLHQ